MGFNIPSRLIGTFTAAAVALTTFSAAPAYADRDDRAARAVAAILGLAVVGAIINDHKQDKKAKRVYREAPVRKPQAHVYRQAPKAHRKVSRPHYRQNGRVVQNRRVMNSHNRLQARPLPRRVYRQQRN